MTIKLVAPAIQAKGKIEHRFDPSEKTASPIGLRKNHQSFFALEPPPAKMRLLLQEAAGSLIFYKK